MVDYAYAPNMAHDFELYANQDYMVQQQPYVSSATYIDPLAFTSSFEPVSMAAMSEAPPRAQDLQSYYDGIAQGVKPSLQQYSPMGSPESLSNAFDQQPPILSASSESGASVSSSTVGSPSLHPEYDAWNGMHGLGLGTSIVPSSSGYEYDGVSEKFPGCIDPNLVQPFGNPIYPHSPYPPEIRPSPSPYFSVIGHPPSPAPSHASSRSHQAGSRHIKRGSKSPQLHSQAYPYPNFTGSRRPSNASVHSQFSRVSQKSVSSIDVDDECREKGMCPLPDCGRVFKDLKAHMLTHLNERPEKCPITTCEYHLKGFARKYDKNRHTLTHYKGTMVCGFCPGSGSAAEKSFNRADVFKRHLTSVHGVEQNPPNSRKKSPVGRKGYSSSQQTMAGTCSTCSVTFANAQEFYEHLDDCVLRVVQQTDPSEAINQKLLTSVADDKDVAETMDRNGLSNSVEYTVPSYDDDDEEDDEEIDVDDQNDDTYGVRRSRSGKGSIKNKGH